MKVETANCSGTSTVNVDNTFIGYGDTKEKAKANLMDKDCEERRSGYKLFQRDVC